MSTNSQRPKHRDAALSSLNVAVEGVNLAKELSGVTPAKAVFGTVSVILTMIRDTVGQAMCLDSLAWLLRGDNQLDAAEEAASRAIDLLSEGDNQFLVCRCRRGLGYIYHSGGKTEKAIHHYEVALGIASSFNWHDEVFWIHHSLASLFFDRNRFDDAISHIEHSKSLAVNNPYNLARAMELQARVWCQQRRFEQAKSEALRAMEVFEKHGAALDLERCNKLLGRINSALN